MTPLRLAGGGGGADGLDLGVYVAEGGHAAVGPAAQDGDHVRYGTGGEVAQGADARDVDGLADGVEGSAEEAGVDGGDD